MINVIEDIEKIIENDTLHDVKILFEPSGVEVKLIEKDFSENIIRIKFDANDDYICATDGMIGIGEIDIVKDIMIYFEDNTSELIEICTKLDWCGRQG